jgi:hypothetical protein
MLNPMLKVATASENRLSLRRNPHAVQSERPIWLAVIGWLHPIYWAPFSPRLPLLRKSLPAPTPHALREICRCD